MHNSGFFNGDQEYGQEEFNRYFNNLYESGVSIDNDGKMTLEVLPGTGKVVVTQGFAIVQGFYYYNDAAINLTVAPDAKYQRVDRVVVRLNAEKGPVEVVLKKGTAASSPKPPSLQRSNEVYELSLAQVVVKPTGSITVKDERFDLKLCGEIRPKNQTGYNEMVKEYQKRWEEWFESQQGEGQRNIFVQANEPESEVAGSIWIEILSQ